jgi:molecular chaperone GrpE
VTLHQTLDGPSNPAGGDDRPAAASSAGAARIAELEAALALARAEVAASRERLLRQRAAMAEHKRRRALELAATEELERRRLFRQLVAVLDDLGRVTAYEATGDRSADARAVSAGLRATYVRFLDVLRSAQVEPLEATGRPFDPAWHEAVAAVETTTRPEGEVVEEVQRGYRYDGELLRPARVTVAVRSSEGRPAVGRTSAGNAAVTG